MRRDPLTLACNHCHEAITDPTTAQLVQISPNDEHWRAFHDNCLNEHEPNDGVFSSVAYWIPLNELLTTNGLHEWNQHLNHKSWIHRTDWPAWHALLATEAR